MLYLSACWLLIAAVMFGLTFFIPILVGAIFSGGGGAAAGSAHHGACSSGSSGGGAASDPQQEQEQQQQSSALVALAAAIPFMAAAAGMNLNAWMAERANERHRHAGIPILLAASTLAALPLALRLAGPGPAFVLLSLACGFCWSFHGEQALLVLQGGVARQGAAGRSGVRPACARTNANFFSNTSLLLLPP